MSQQQSSHLVITGLMANNCKFRPSDWPHRLSSICAQFGKDQKLRYSKQVYPSVFDGLPCLFVSPQLEEIDPASYKFIMDFASSNRLVIKEPLN